MGHRVCIFRRQGMQHMKVTVGAEILCVSEVPAWLATRGNLHNDMCFGTLSMLQCLWRSSIAIRYMTCAAYSLSYITLHDLATNQTIGSFLVGPCMSLCRFFRYAGPSLALHPFRSLMIKENAAP